MPPREVGANLGVLVPTLYHWVPASSRAVGKRASPGKASRPVFHSPLPLSPSSQAASHESHSSGTTRRARSAEAGRGRTCRRPRAAAKRWYTLPQWGSTFWTSASGGALTPREVPFIPGVEGAGVVRAVGEGVRSAKPGDRVAFTDLPDTYAEAIVAERPSA